MAMMAPINLASAAPSSFKTNNGVSSSSVSMSHAVSRSSELLSCAKTALKISKSEYNQYPNNNHKQPPRWLNVDPLQLRLHISEGNESIDPEIDALLEDGVALLRTMEKSLQKLQGLVRRRGHTNDPTNEIGVCVQNLESDAKELARVVDSLKLAKTKSKQHGRHLELVAAWLQNVASKQTAKLKQVLKVRGDVLADQAQRRKLLNPRKQNVNKNSSSGGAGINMNGRLGSGSTLARSSSSNGTPWDSPLFTMTASSAKASPAARSAPPSASTASHGTNGSSRTRAAPPLYGNGVNSSMGGGSGYYGGGAAGYGSAGYGGGYGGGASTGMRQRRTTATATNKNRNNENDDSDNIQAQIQLREQDRQSKARLESARQAERSLADLGQLFGKMSSLIHAQGEVLENIEDDVESALVDVTAGQEEIGKLYALKKGNRALILKVFGIVIFFIIFMRLY